MSLESPNGRKYVPTAFARENSWVLMYHSVDTYEEDPNLLTVRPDRFARQIDWLRRRGLRGVGMSELLRARAQGRAGSLVGLTFDDGYTDFTRHVLPILDELGFSATVYVVAGLIGGHNVWDAGAPRKDLLTAEQVRSLADAGVEIGSHGFHHVRLPGLGDAELTTETALSRELLEEITRHPVNSFCYPYGAVDAAAVSAVRTAGYDHACAIDHSPLTDRWSLPRCYVGDSDGGWRLRAKRARHLMRDHHLATASRRGAGGLRTGTVDLPVPGYKPLSEGPSPARSTAARSPA
ncbi:polysaccharide deacetylase family protein [Kitasatospora sp. RB6PN24]|uniref:polysaccharide deacetylase family protein n=1 Tax=Kitasatospora humi TaxID=2893891 RepID=UPI001E2E8E7B|nr:polysaccharide deacetylase family protein [Kitasatospora humi]MCC9311795.1 polysaccharide deacetylase family protein [Kitasatospora humi]